MNYKVESGVPIPPRESNKMGAPRKYPFWSMRVGDSFFVPKVGANTMNGAIGYVQKKTGYVFTRRSVIEDGVSGVRIWRAK